MDPKIRVLETAKAFCQALIEDGQGIHTDGGGLHINLAIIKELDQISATRGKGDVLQARVRDIDAELARYRAALAEEATSSPADEEAAPATDEEPSLV